MKMLKIPHKRSLELPDSKWILNIMQESMVCRNAFTNLRKTTNLKAIPFITILERGKSSSAFGIRTKQQC